VAYIHLGTPACGPTPRRARRERCVDSIRGMQPLMRSGRIQWVAAMGVSLALVGCGARAPEAGPRPIEPGDLPACTAAQPAPVLTAPEQAQVQALRSTYAAIIAQGAQANADANKTTNDALARGDAKTAQSAVQKRLAGPTQTMDFLSAATFPGSIRTDASVLLKALQDQRVRDQAFVDARTDSAVRTSNHQRVVHIIVLENALNQFRTDLGLSPLPCPFY
jgi:hypothetical protein